MVKLWTRELSPVCGTPAQSQGSYLGKQAQQILIAELIGPELGSPSFQFQKSRSECAPSTMSRFCLREARSQWAQTAIVIIISGVQMTWFTKAESRVKSRATYFTPTEMEIWITAYEMGMSSEKNLILQLQLNSMRWQGKRLQCTRIGHCTQNWATVV